MIDTETYDSHILTGAGFTKNFGGFLAREMWGKIFNNSQIQNNQKLRSVLIKNPDFEQVYAEVIENTQFTEDDKLILQNVVEKAYYQLDDAIKNWTSNNSNPLAFNSYGLNSLFGSCLSSGAKKSYFFTLNQDLLMERRNGYFSPGVPRFPNEFYNLHGKNFEDVKYVEIPSEDVSNKIKKDILNHAGPSYIKLHGSFGWRASDGSRQMVLGKNKERDIQKEPLLQAYFEIFKNTLQGSNKKLLIIGYGFGDQHINEVLAQCVAEHGLSLYIITNSSINELGKRLNNGHVRARPLLDGVRGYFQHNSFKEIFPTDQSETVHFKEIMRSLTSK